MSIRCAFLSVCLLTGSVLAATPAPSRPSGQTPPPASGSRVELPGGTQRIQAGVGMTAPTSPQQAAPTSLQQAAPTLSQQLNRSHHVRRQEALQHAQGVTASREQLRAQSAAKPASAP